jgi:hypothetical protein
MESDRHLVRKHYVFFKELMNAGAFQDLDISVFLGLDR